MTEGQAAAGSHSYNTQLLSLSICDGRHSKNYVAFLGTQHASRSFAFLELFDTRIDQCGLRASFKIQLSAHSSVHCIRARHYVRGGGAFNTHSTSAFSFERDFSISAVTLRRILLLLWLLLLLQLLLRPLLLLQLLLLHLLLPLLLL